MTTEMIRTAEVARDDHLPARRREPVLRVTGLTVRYGDTVTVRDVHLELRAGETVALVGGSGAGKSTIAKAIAGLVAPSAGSALLDIPAHSGDRHDRVDLLAAAASVRRTARRAVHLVMQDPYASLPPHRRVLDIVAEPLVIHRIGDTPARTEAARSALLAVGLDPAHYARRFPHELSGGERQRVAFARAIVTRPAVILADEPTGMLDATLRAEVSQLMGDLARDHGTAILHITHDLALAAHTCDRVLVMADGAIVEQGPTAQVLRNPHHPTTKQLLLAALRGSRRRTGTDEALPGA
ncbi:ABC transporter ATP-binding protein [Nocardia flavorosea]|uniref:ABC transporter ATP-binding protein n=1 Tax=Nocardia flavorosea TaxID=53429 RepID=UPI0018935337|nr:ABC transporter ATP-binding protein [Nocardia flavorosea]MBF6350662.1 ABC transporter ATP-binding protein [Nocardia flavorosea]